MLSEEQNRIITQSRVDIARLDAHFSHVTKALEDLQEEIQKLTDKTNEINRILDQASGGWKTMMAIGGSASVVGGAISWFVSHFKWGA